MNRIVRKWQKHAKAQEEAEQAERKAPNPQCSGCGGTGKLARLDSRGTFMLEACPRCQGKGAPQ